jgi:DNA-binding transcriptional LysR family regulator
MLVTLRQLQYVISVSETGSFSKAADACFAEQSTVSQQIRTMEERLGTVIFDRSTIPVKVTPEGEIIINQAKEIIEKVDELIKPFKNPKNKRFAP